MRTDMAKVVTISTFRPSYARCTFKPGRQTAVDDLPVRESMRTKVAHSRFCSTKTVNTAPIRRWLRSQTGRPWADVYSELRRNFNVNKGNDLEVLEFVDYLVDRKTFFAADGTVMAQGNWSKYAVNGLYVHPNTQVLAYASPVSQSARVRRANREAALRTRRIDVSPSLQLHKVSNIWYWVELAPITAPQWVELEALDLGEGRYYPRSSIPAIETVCKDVLTSEHFTFRGEYKGAGYAHKELYGSKKLYGKRKWQASSADLKKYVNS